MPKSHVFAFNPPEFQKKLLEWYGKNRRDLPWRAKKGEKSNPYHVWLSEIMLQQTTVPTVIPYFQKFTTLWPDVTSLAKAKSDDVMSNWAGLGYYARARNLVKCAQVIHAAHKGKFPDTEDTLIDLPGIGPYTSAAIAAIAFDRPSVVVDGNIERIAARVFAVAGGKAEQKLAAKLLYDDIAKRGKEAARDLPQALMDLGTSICTPANPKCAACPVSSECKAYLTGQVAAYPVKAIKKAVPTRHGRVYWLQTSNGEVVLERRADDRMLGGMVALPTTDWDRDEHSVVAHPAWLEKVRGLTQIGEIRHSFSHFHLILEVWGTDCLRKNDFSPKTRNLSYTSSAKAGDSGLPTVFKKAARLAAGFYNR